nr:pyridoxamine 5'-phosphate oxidase [Stackebrandtia albiflava]
MTDFAADPAAMRRDYTGRTLLESHAPREPFTLFTRWFDDAVRDGGLEPNAMVLATTGPDGAPRQRTVLLKAFSTDGFVFYTNYESDKARQIDARPGVGLLFGWYRQHRQVIVSGTASRVPRPQTEAYFATRPHGSQLAAWASRQSRPLPDRDSLDAEYRRAAARFPGDVPAPPHWGGYRVVPHEIEFWQGRADRLHDRLRYRRAESGGWVVARLAP